MPNSLSVSVRTVTVLPGPAAMVKGLTVTLYSVNLFSPLSSVLVFGVEVCV